MKKVLIVGAGAQGTVINWVLSRADDVAEVLVGDIDMKRMQEIVEASKSSKVKIKKLDASNIDGMVELMKGEGFDLVVNATLPRFNDPIMEACYAAKTAYMDMACDGHFPGGDKNLPVNELKYARKWEEANIKGLILAGSDAGTTNVLAKEGVEELDEVDSIRIKDYAITESEKPIVLWQPQTYLEDLATPAVIWDNGYKEMPPFSGEEEYDFPPPIGTKGKVYYHNHEEPLTIPKFVGKPVRYVDFKMGEPAYMLWKSIYDLGLMSEEPIEIKGGKVAPRDVLFKLLPPTPSVKELKELVKSGTFMSRMMVTVDVYGKKAGKKLRCKLWTEGPNAIAACERIPGASDVSYATAVSGAIFALMLLRGQVNHTGIFPPEVFDKEERKIYFKEMNDRGIKIHKKVEEIL